MKKNPWLWVPSLYFAEGLPYVVVMTVSVIMYKRLGLSNTDIAIYTSWLYLPWVIKWLWSPLVTLVKTNQFWIYLMQLLIGASFAGIGLTIPAPDFLQYTLIFFWLVAFSSATHDIACDGFYMQGLDQHQQTFFVGIRNTFYRLAMITGQGLIIIIAGYLESQTGLATKEVTVESVTQGTIDPTFEAEDMMAAVPDGETEIRISKERLEIPVGRIAPSHLDSILDLVGKKNYQRMDGGIPDPGFDNQDAPAQSDAEQVLSGFEKFIKDNFGEEDLQVSQEFNGNYALLAFTLSSPPDDPVTVNFGRDRGSKNIRLIEGANFVFNQENWNEPAYALIEVDPKLRGPESAVFAATAGNVELSWVISFIILAILFILFLVYHRFALPKKVKVPPVTGSSNLLTNFSEVFISFFKKRRIGLIVAFLLFYRLGESQLVKISSPFLLDSQENGGLGLTTGEIGLAYGTFGVVFLTIGGLIGGFVAARQGLKFWLPWMVIAINVPNVVYIFLAHNRPDSFWLISSMVSLEQFGYGFGFTAYMLYNLYISHGKFETAHYAICTGFMALGMMLPGMFSGWLQELIGYQHFFIWVLIATIPSFIVAFLVDVDPDFGKKKEVQNESA